MTRFNLILKFTPKKTTPSSSKFPSNSPPIPTHQKQRQKVGITFFLVVDAMPGKKSSFPSPLIQSITKDNSNNLIRIKFSYKISCNLKLQS